MKKFLFLLALPLLFVANMAFAQETLKDFDDVPAGHPNYDAILLMRYEGVLEGYDDNTFRPDNLINRVEALKLAYEVSGLEVIPGVAPSDFTDTAQGLWYSPYINQAVYKEIVQGYPDGSFKPEQNVNLVEFLKMLLLAQNVDLSDALLPSIPYADTMPGQWYTKYTDFAYTNGLLDADSENNIYPAHFITRAEAAEIIYRFSRLELADIVTDEPADAEAPEQENDETASEPTYEDEDLALYVSETYGFAINYPKFWFYAGADSEDEIVIREYQFGPDDLTENDPLVILELLPLATEVDANIESENVSLQEESGESEISIIRKIEDNRVYKISGPTDQRDNMLRMIISIKTDIEGLESFNPAEESENPSENEATEETAPTEEAAPTEDAETADTTTPEEGQADTSDPDAI